MWRTAALLLVLLGSASASAERGTSLSVLCESHAGSRPAGADGYLEGVRAGLEDPDVVAGPALDALIAEHHSRPAGDPAFPLFRLVRGQALEAREEAVAGLFRQAVERMQRLHAIVAQQPAALAVSPHVRRPLFEGTLAQLKGLVRLRRQGEAESLALELGRRYPDFPVTERDHGPEVAQFVTQVRRQSRVDPAYGLVVETNPPGAAVFVDERHAGTSPLHLQGLEPGRYRVMARLGERYSRVHTAAVLEGAAFVRIDLDLDQALAAGGFQFASEAERERREASYAVRLGRMLGAAQVITVGLTGSPERPQWGATVYSPATGAVLRSAAVALAPTPPPRALLVKLGRFLRGAGPADGLIVQQAGAGLVRGAGDPANPEGAPHHALRRWAYLALVLGGASLAAGAVLLARSCTPAEEARRCPYLQVNRPAGIALVAGGGGLATAGGVLWLLDSRRERARVALGPARLLLSLDWD